MAVQQFHSGVTHGLGAVAERAVVLRVDNPTHWQVLRSPYRMRILESLHGSAGCSIKDLADALGCSSTALYYHLDLLVQAGAITSTVLEPDEIALHRGGRRPAVFAAAGESVVVQYDPTRPESCKRVAMMRKAWLDESQAESMPHIGAGDPSVGVPPSAAWEVLSDAEADELREHLERAQAVLAAARARRHEGEAMIAPATHHVLLGMIPVPSETLPSPMITLEAMRGIAPAAEQRGAAELL